LNENLKGEMYTFLYTKKYNGWNKKSSGLVK
jgi:hypothetical protein